MAMKFPDDLDESMPQVGDTVMFRIWDGVIRFGKVLQLIWPRPHEADIGIGTAIEVTDSRGTLYYPERGEARVLLKSKEK